MRLSVVWNVEENTNEMWEKVTEDVKRVAKEDVGESRSSIPENKQI